MPNALQKEKEQYATFINTLVLHHFRVVRLIEIFEDEEDIWYKLEAFPMIGNLRIINSSVLIPIVPLKGVLPDKEYNEMVRIWNINKQTQIESIQ